MGRESSPPMLGKAVNQPVFIEDLLRLLHRAASVRESQCSFRETSLICPFISTIADF